MWRVLPPDFLYDPTGRLTTGPCRIRQAPTPPTSRVAAGWFFVALKTAAAVRWRYRRCARSRPPVISPNDPKET